MTLKRSKRCEVSPLFVYGTLLDAKVRYQVLGRTLAHKTIKPAILKGHVRVYLAGRSYPVLVPSHKPHGVRGLLLTALTLKDKALLDAYEGDPYSLVPIHVWGKGRKRIRALVYGGKTEARASKRPWTPPQGLLRSRSFFQ